MRGPDLAQLVWTRHSVIETRGAYRRNPVLPGLSPSLPGRPARATVSDVSHLSPSLPR